jgi:hypothetical protein
MFPIHNRSASENAFGIDYFDGVVVTLDKTGKYHINTENNLPKSLEDLSQGNVPNGDVLRKYGVLDSEGKLNFQIQDGVDVDRVVRKKDTRNKEIYAKESPEYYDAAYNTIKRLWTEFKNEYSTGYPDQAKIKRSELFDMFKSLGLSYADDSMKGFMYLTFMSKNSQGLLQVKTLIANTIVLDKVINEDIAKFIQKKKSK